MKLAQLFASYSQYLMGKSSPTQDVSGITTDSRQVAPGTVFIAIRGTQQDGHDFLPRVLLKNPIAVVVSDKSRVPPEFQGAVLVVADTRSALDVLASRFYGQPAQDLFCVGVTGTNGKTSTAYMIESLLTAFGWPTGVMGTIDHHMGDRVWESQLTTPDPLVLQKRLSEFKALGAQAAVFEVSSHALDQRRVEHVPFDVTVFTNLTRDHLDYHKTMENYFAAKARLFEELLAKSTKAQTWAVLNGDDPWAKKINVSDRAQVWTYGQRPSDFQFQISNQGFAGTEFTLKSPRGSASVKLSVPGAHNVGNATAAVAVAMAAGASLETATEAMSQFLGVPGRLQRVPTARNLNVFVDYAHTDDALRVVLSALSLVRERSGLAQTQIITVFGCGGDRDQGKRPLMAQSAVEGSDMVFVTSDNPRSEDPEKIINDVLKGVPSEMINHKVFVEVDRRKAIGRAIQSAQPGDVILIAGKGHESYQYVGSEKIPFSDVKVAQEWL